MSSQSRPELLFPFQHDRVRTVFTPLARLVTQDVRDGRIREGLRLTLRTMSAIFERVGERAEIAIVLIPTKELVFAELLGETSTQAPDALRAVIEAEQGIRRKIERYLDRRRIAWIDPVPSLRSRLASGRSPYFEDWDGHPNAVGHEAIASTAARHRLLVELGRRSSPAQ